MTPGTGPALQIRQGRSIALTPQLRQAIGLLRLDNAALVARLEEVAARNPALKVTRGARPVGARGEGSGGAGADRVPVAQPGPGLREHVAREIGLAFRDPALRRIAGAFAEALEPSGWLGAPVPEVAARAGCAPALAERVLARLQGMEPAGLFARSLAECLRLQAAERGLLDTGMAALLDHLDLVARGRVAELAELCGTDAAGVATLIAQVRRLDPKPGARFGAGPEPIRPPDVTVSPAPGGGWHVELNDDTTPRVEVRAPGADHPAPDRPALDLRAALAEARWLRTALERRNATVLKVVGEVALAQDGFLRRGHSALVPLTFSEVAGRAGLHETTVGRVAAGLMVATPQGTLPLRAFFGAALAGGGDGPAVAAAAVRHRLAALIAAEDPARPLSDSALAERLAAEGAVVARRTVAKYREALGQPGAAARRARAALRATR